MKSIFENTEFRSVFKWKGEKNVKWSSLDVEYADVYLPSICQIAIVDWDDAQIIGEFCRYINPDCEFQAFLQKRHGIQESDVASAPFLYDIWDEICGHLSGRVVVVNHASQTVRALRQLAEIDCLRFPDMVFCSLNSIARRCWPWLESEDLEGLCARLGIFKKSHEALSDARAAGQIVCLAMQDQQAGNPAQLFTASGFAGGLVYKGRQIPYRAHRKNTGCQAWINGQKGVRLLDWDYLAESDPCKQRLSQAVTQDLRTEPKNSARLEYQNRALESLWKSEEGNATDSFSTVY